MRKCTYILPLIVGITSMVAAAELPVLPVLYTRVAVPASTNPNTVAARWENQSPLWGYSVTYQYPKTWRSAEDSGQHVVDNLDPKSHIISAKWWFEIYYGSQVRTLEEVVGENLASYRNNPAATILETKYTTMGDGRKVAISTIRFDSSKPTYIRDFIFILEGQKYFRGSGMASADTWDQCAPVMDAINESVTVEKIATKSASEIAAAARPSGPRTGSR